MKKDISNSYYSLMGFVISVTTLLLGFYLFYEYFFEHHYWHNRILLYKKLKRGEWYPISDRVVVLDGIREYVLNNGGRVWIYPPNLGGNRRDVEVLTYSEGNYSDYIGLYLFSPIMKYYNKKILSENFLSVQDSRDLKIKKILR